MHKPYSVLTVCTGNICRSPMAEQMLRNRLSGFDVAVDSAGISDEEHGSRIHPLSARVLDEHGIEVGDHRARVFERSDYDAFDLILAMDYNHYRSLLRGAPDDEARAKVHLIREFDPSTGDDERGIPDPWYGDYSGYESTFSLLENTLDGVAEYVAEHQRG